MKKIHVFLILLFLTILPIFKYHNIFSQKTNIAEIEKKYSLSQYVLGEASPEKISDGDLYIYAGFAYLKGEDPTTINFEHPPLGKYLYGLSYFLFGNSQLINIPIYFFILLNFYFLLKKILAKNLFILLSLITFGGLNIVQAHTSQNFLDLFQLLFILMFFNMLFKSKENNAPKKFFLIGIILGCIVSIKYYFPMLGLFLAIVTYWSYSENKLKYTLLSVFSMALTYFSTYFVYFQNNHSLLDLIKFEWFRFRWWTGDRTIPKFLIFNTIFLGKFKGWWDDTTYQIAENWSLFWPILFLGQFLSVKNIRKNKKIAVLFFYSTCVITFYAFGSAAYERYLIQLIPFWIILFVNFLEKTILLHKPKQPDSHKIN